MIPHAGEIEAVWQQGKRARAEYAAHPFSTWQYGAGCICAWCDKERGRFRARLRAYYWRTRHGKDPR